MRNLLNFGIAVALAVVLVGCSAQSSSVLVGQKAPFTQFVMMDGSYQTTENYKGSNLLLVFWVTTCAHSHTVLEDVSSWERTYGRKFNVKVLAVNIDKSTKEERVREIYSEPKLSYVQHAYSGNDIYDQAYIAFDVGETPTLVLIDPRGKIIGSGDTMDVLRDAFPGS